MAVLVSLASTSAPQTNAAQLLLPEVRAALQLWRCDNSTNRVARVQAHRTPNHQQRFQFSLAERTLKLVSNLTHGGLCLDRSGNHQFAALLLSPCDQSDGQLWNVSSSSGSSSSFHTTGLVTIQSQMPGSDFGCIGASAPVSAGTALQLAPDCGSLLTEWQQLPASPQSTGIVQYRLKYSKSTPIALNERGSLAPSGTRHRCNLISRCHTSTHLSLIHI